MMVVDLSARAPGRRGGKCSCLGRVVRVSEMEHQEKVGVACTIDSYALMPADQQ